MGGLVGYGAYVPYYQLERTRIAGVLGSGGGSGTRSVAAFDEDTTSMAVAAGRAALASLSGPGGQPDRACVRQLFFATTVPAYADKTNATAVHAALRRPGYRWPSLGYGTLARRRDRHGRIPVGRVGFPVPPSADLTRRVVRRV